MTSLNEHALKIFDYCLSSTADGQTTQTVVDAIEYTAIAIGRHAYRLDMRREEILAWIKLYYKPVFVLPGLPAPFAMPEVYWRILAAWRLQKEIMEGDKSLGEAFPEYERLRSRFTHTS